MTVGVAVGVTVGVAVGVVVGVAVGVAVGVGVAFFVHRAYRVTACVITLSALSASPPSGAVYQPAKVYPSAFRLPGNFAPIFSPVSMLTLWRVPFSASTKVTSA